VVVPSYILLAGTERPLIVKALALTVLEVVASFALADAPTKVMLPLYGDPATVALAVNLTNIVVAEIAPVPSAVFVTNPANPAPVVRETSNPAGAVIVTTSAAPKLLAVKEKVVSLETVP